MYTNNRHSIYQGGNPIIVPKKWDLLRSIGKDKLSASAQMKLEWIIFYYTVGEESVTDTAAHFGISRKTLHKWLNRFDETRLERLEEDSRSPHKTRGRDISPLQRVRIIKLRKAHLRWGKMKLQKLYVKEYGEAVSSWKIQKVIEESNLYFDTKAHKKQQKRKEQAQINPKRRITEFVKKHQVHHLWHVDTVLLTLSTGGYRYLLTAIDDVSKIAYARLYTTHSSKHAADFLKRLHYLTEGEIINLHHDNGSEFEKDFKKACEELNLPQWYSRVRMPKDNSVLERFNRTIQEEFVDMAYHGIEDLQEFNQELTEWLVEYNSVRPHQALDYLTPLEYIDTYLNTDVLPMSSSLTTKRNPVFLCYNFYCMISDKYIYPDFTNSLVNVPHSILAHFDLPHAKPALQTPLLEQIKDCSKLVLFLIDGFGYNLFKNEATKFSFFQKIATNNLSEKITTTFPSTTAANITTFETGLTPREHGLFKWNLYFDEIDAVLQPLPYKVVQTEYHPTNISLPTDTSMLISDKTMYEHLAEGSIPSFYFIPKLLKDNLYTKAISKGATIIPYISIVDMLISLRNVIRTTKGRAFCYVYWGAIDSQEHMYGPWTEQARAEIGLFDEMIQKNFINMLDERTRNETALMITADHGQTAIDPEETIYLNDFPQITNHFKKSRNGIPIPPTGNPRDAFLHIEEDKVDETMAFLQKTFGTIADIVKLDKPTVDRLFGTEGEHKEFANRLGNILILPTGKQSIWYRYLPEQKVEYRGHHGGLTEDEMYIPFIAARITALQ